MVKQLSERNRAILLALLVTFLWSTSWVLIKIGLAEIPPLTFGGIRYFLAGMALLPGLLQKERRAQLKSFSRRQWLQLSLYGLVAYTITQGFQFLAISRLTAATSSLILTFTPLIVALMSIPLLNEKPLPRHWLGMALFGFGLVFYFQPDGGESADALGLLFGVISLLANALSSIIGRDVNRDALITPYLVTTVSMLIGGSILFAAGWVIQGIPAISLQGWGIILWLAVINGAFAFTLWNQSLRTLSATDSAIIANTMLIQIAFLAWVFLNEKLTILEIIGLTLAISGTIVAQVRLKRKAAPPGDS